MKEVNVEKRADELLITLVGEIDSGNADAFFNTVSEAFASDSKNLHFMCDGLAFIDSTTLGAFVKLLKRVRGEGKAMRLSGLQPKIKKLFTICALDKIMEIDE